MDQQLKFYLKLGNIELIPAETCENRSVHWNPLHIELEKRQFTFPESKFCPISMEHNSNTSAIASKIKYMLYKWDHFKFMNEFMNELMLPNMIPISMAVIGVYLGRKLSPVQRNWPISQKCQGLRKKPKCIIRRSNFVGFSKTIKI